MNNIKYEFALDKNKNTVHISEVNKKLIEKYSCYGCSKELIPRKGDVNAHHFAHKSSCRCSNKTYLSKLAIETLYASYRECLQKQKPFILEKIDLSSGALDSYDITEYFKNVSKNDQRSDILLSDQNGSVLLINFIILGKSKSLNCSTNNRLIEINIDSEQNVKEIVENQFRFKSNIELHNFKAAYNYQNIKEYYYIITKKNKEQKIGKAPLKYIEDYLKLHENEVLNKYIHNVPS